MKSKYGFSLLNIIALALLGIFVAEEVAAVVGRPLTPVSVAGVSRRTARRVSRRN